MAGNRKYNKLGEDIRDSLMSGLSTGDFSGLNNAINDSVNTVIREVTGSAERSIRTKTAEYKERIQREHAERDRAEAYRRQQLEKQREDRRIREELYREQRSRRRNQKQAGKQLPANFNPIGQTSSTLCMAGGAVGMGVSAVSALAKLVQTLIGAGSISGIIASGVMLAISAILFATGLNSKSILDRAKRYAEICGSKMYARISDIAASTGMKRSKILKDIKKMLRKGYFTEGYIDEQETTLMLSDSLYEQYRNTEKQKEINEQQTREDLEDQAVNMDAASSLSPEELTELNSMIAEGMESTRKLHEYNDKIPGEVISRKLEILERLLNEIFNRVKAHPEQMHRIHKLMDYYLPTMLKLVEAYADYDRVSAPGPDIIEAKKEIEKTLDTINRAFVKLLNNMFEDSVWDVTTDAKVLKTMLAQEGLTDDMDEFKENGTGQTASQAEAEVLEGLH